MKKFALLLIGGIAALILLSHLGPLIGLAITLVILYYIMKQFLTTDSVGWKIALAILGLFILSGAIQNIPAIIAIVAAYVLYLVIKKWNSEKTTYHKSDDPFQNFEKQWSELNNKKY